MSGKKKHKKTDRGSFTDYLGNRMTGEERNSFERELQKDPFAAEALEGLSSLDEDEVGKDLDGLKARIQNSGRPKHNRINFYRIAAAVAGLVLVTSVYLAFDKKIRDLKNGKIAVVENTEKRADIPEEFETDGPASRESGNLPGVESDSPEKEKALRVEPEPRENIKSADSSKDRELAENDKKAPATEPAGQAIIPDQADKETQNSRAGNKEEDVTDFGKEPVASPEISGAFTGKRSRFISKSGAPVRNEMQGLVTGKVISADDSSLLPGVVVRIRGLNEGTVTDRDGKYRLKVPQDSMVTLVADFVGMESAEVNAKPGMNVNISMEPSLTSLDEVVVTGYGTRKTDDNSTVIEMNEEPAYSGPAPVSGFNDFRSYISENMEFPDGYPEMNRAVVVLKFSVGKDQRPVNIEILKSPGKGFSDEALRLLENGPGWNRATMNGTVVDVETRIRIVFERKESNRDR